MSEQEIPDGGKPVPQKKRHRALKIIGWSILGLLLTVVLAVVLVYMPPIQRFVVGKVLDSVNSGSDMQIKVNDFRLRFPLNLTVEGVDISQYGDTMLHVGSLHADAALIPLVTGRIVVDDIGINGVVYKQGTPDSLMCMRAVVGTASINHASVNLTTSNIDIGNLALRSGSIRMAMKNDTTPPSPPGDDLPWRLKIGNISLIDVDFDMAMESSISSVAASLFNLKADEGDIDLSSRKIRLGLIDIDGIDGKVLTDPEASADTASVVADTIPARPWGIDISKIRLKHGDVLYALKDATPQPGLDMNYLKVDSVAIEVDSLSMLGSAMRIPIRRLYAYERSGLSIDTRGLFEMDSTMISARDFEIRTLASEITLSALYGMAPDSDQAPLMVNIAAEIAPIDILLAMPDMKELITALPQNRKMVLAADLKGTLADLRLEQLRSVMKGYWDIKARGKIANITDFNNAVGQVDIVGDLTNLNFAKPMMLDAAARPQVNLPPLRLLGNVDLRRGVIDGSLQAMTGDGDVALNAHWNNRSVDYSLNLDADRFPVNAFLPGLGIGEVTTVADIKGHGLDVFSDRTSISGRVDVVDLRLRHHSVRNVAVSGELANGLADVSIVSRNPVLDMSVKAAGNLAGDCYDWSLTGDVNHVDLEALGFTDTIATVAINFDGSASLAPKRKTIGASLDINDMKLVMGKTDIAGNQIALRFNTSDSLTSALLTNHDLKIDFVSPMSLDTIMERFDSVSSTIVKSLNLRHVDVMEFHRSLPQFNLEMTAGNNNVLEDYLASTGTSFRRAGVKMSNDSIISFDADIDSLNVGETRLDNIKLNAYQRDEYLRYKLLIDNKPGTFDEFAQVQANGYIAENKLSVFVRQKNIEGKTGYNLGAMVTLRDSTFTLKMVPYKPIIAYKTWTINSDNYIVYNFVEPNLTANLMMQNNESSLHLYTTSDSIAGSDIKRERVYLDIDNVKIQDWLALNPYMPPMKGDLSAKVRIGLDGNILTGDGTVILADFTYNKRRVGTFDLGLDLSTSRSGTVHAKTTLAVDGQEAITASGNLNDSTAIHPFLLDFRVIHFPLAVANPFISQTGTLSGYLNGEMDVTGSLESPRFNGFIAFDSAEIKVGMLGSSFRFSEEKVPVDSNIVRFSGYEISGANKNPLTIDGIIDTRHLTNIGIDLAMKARDMQIVSNSKNRRSNVYGKAFISLDATAKGALDFLNINANLSVNSGTNVTYVMPDATAALASRSNSDMVRFVNFADTLAVVQADTVGAPASAMFINALLTVQPGAIIGVDLATTGNNRVQIAPAGTLDYNLSPLSDSRLTGRLNINSGYVRYTPPFMSEKLFHFQDGSYITFNGDMLDPQLNISAIDQIQANVTQQGQNSRLIYFDVGLKVEGTLDRMDVKFDLSTDDDLTVQNELQSMSPEQRANQAINMLLYNTYTGPNTKGNANLGGNPLYSFLESQVNSWMANNIKGIDISFGIDQYKRTLDGNSSTTMNYSYKVSKSLFDDRVKIVVGGNYSTDTDPEENVSDNLINDISIEYYINNKGTMYVRLFRHTGFESILEGEITQTGVGFVYKRKLRKFRYLFNFLYPKNWKHGENKEKMKSVEIVDSADEIPD